MRPSKEGTLRYGRRKLSQPRRGIATEDLRYTILLRGTWRDPSKILKPSSLVSPGTVALRGGGATFTRSKKAGAGEVRYSTPEGEESAAQKKR